MGTESECPLLAHAIDGFGNKDPGNRRATQFRLPCDMLHPGRQFAVKLADSPVTVESLLKRIEVYLAGRPLDKLPRALARQSPHERPSARPPVGGTAQERDAEIFSGSGSDLIDRVLGLGFFHGLLPFRNSRY
jgi:Eco29kI restriction endonuclease